MKRLALLGLIACALAEEAKGDGAACPTKMGCGACIAAPGCTWCEAKGVSGLTGLAACVAGSGQADCTFQFGTMTKTPPVYEMIAVENGGKCSYDSPSPFMKEIKTCTDCVTNKQAMWCEVEDREKDWSGGICLNISPPQNRWCLLVAFEAGAFMKRISTAATAKTCPTCSAHTCGGQNGCLKMGGCSWCYAKNTAGVDAKLGFCTPKDCGDASQFGTLEDVAKITMGVATETCPTADDKPNPLVLGKTSCSECLTDEGNQWCKVYGGPFQTGGVCLNTTKSSVTCDDALKTSLGATSVIGIDSSADCTTCDQQRSCGACSTADGCNWCGVTVKDEDNKYHSGTQLGLCLAKGKECPANVFGSIKPVLEYNIKKHVYKMEVIPFEANDKGWQQDDCKSMPIDKLANSTAGCKTCTAEKARRWCAVDLKGTNRSGGFCLGVNQPKELCGTFHKTAVAGEFYEATAEVKEICSGGIMASAGHGILLAAIFAALSC